MIDLIETLGYSNYRDTKYLSAEAAIGGVL